MRRRIRNRSAAIWAVVVVGAVLAAGCTPVPNEPLPPALANPDLNAACGIDVNLVIDRSGSIGAEMATVVDASQRFVESLRGTGSRVRTASFADTASVHPNGGTGTPALSGFQWSAVDDYQMPSLAPGGATNLDAGLEVVRRAPGPVGDLTVLFTDGAPNLHHLIEPSGNPGIVANIGRSRSAAVREANWLKQAGTHLFVVGVGQTADELDDFSGPDIFDGTSATTADQVPLASIGDATDAFLALAAGLCGSSLSVATAAVGADEVEYPLPGWRIKPETEPRADWVQPVDGVFPVPTDDQGTATMAWRPTPEGRLVLSVTPEERPEYEFKSIECTVDRFDGQGPQPLADEPGPGSSFTFVVVVADGEAARCRVLYRFSPPDPGAGGTLTVVMPRAPGSGETPSAGLTLNGPGGTVGSVSLPAGGSWTNDELTEGGYVVVVDPVPSGWWITEIRCGDEIGDPATGQVNAVVADGAHLVCVVALAPTPTEAKLILQTSYLPTDAPIGPTTWSLNSAVAQPLTTQVGGSLTWLVDPGAYTLDFVSSLSKYVPVTLSCDGVAHPPQSAGFILAPGAVVLCTATYINP